MATINSRPGGANVPPFDAVQDVRKYAVLREDFVGGLAGTLDDTAARVAELGWKIVDVAGAGDSDLDIVTTASILQGHPGVVSLNTGPTTPASGDEGGLFLNGAVVLPSSGLVYAAAVVRFPSIASIEFNFGLFEATNTAGRAANSVSLEFDASVDAEWNGVTVLASSATAVAGATAVAVDTWYTLELAASSGSAYFWVNGEQIGEVATTLPTVALYPGFKVATEAAAEKSVLLDAFILRQPVDRD